MCGTFFKKKEVLFMTGSEVRTLIKNSGVHQWQIADEIGLAESTFSRRMRYTFTDEEVSRIKEAIEKVQKQEGHVI